MASSGFLVYSVVPTKGECLAFFGFAPGKGLLVHILTSRKIIRGFSIKLARIVLTLLSRILQQVQARFGYRESLSPTSPY